MPRKNERAVETIARLLASQSTLVLSTSGADGDPHATPLFYLTGSELELYWFSSPSSRHSRNLTRESHASVAIYRSTNDWREICGVQMHGQAEKILDRAFRQRIAREYCERFQLGNLFRTAMARTSLYVFRPSWIRYLDNGRRFGFKFEITPSFPRGL
jgi:hypothetical protein